jgi:hypothetical protein
MALTNAQRQIAVQAVLASNEIVAIAPVPVGTPLASLLPGVTAAQVLSTIITAIGSSVDTQLTTVLTNYTAILNAQLTAAEAQVTALEAAIAAA